MSAWVLAGVILTGAWTQLDEIGWVGWLPLLATLVLDRAGARVPAPRWHPSPLTRVPFVACALLCTLILTHVALTAREEFGFGGDEGYHLSATRAFALHYLRAGPMLAAALAVYAAWRWKQWPFAASVAMSALIAASYVLPASPLFGRYPTGFYHLSTPLNVLFEVAGVPYPFTANHIVNALSVPAWLFVLRPLILDRWPDWRVLPVALLVYFQPPALVYVSSALLEPWAAVFLLLALEALVAFEPDERWIAVPIAATATFFKETAILLLPTVWLVACVEWRDWRPSLRRGAMALGAASVIPFLVYYAVRRGVQIERIYALGAATEVWAEARAAAWIANVRAQVGIGGMLAVGVAIVVSARHWWWMVTAVALAVFFFGDVASIPYTGYGRFLAYPLVAVCGAVFAATYRWPERGRAIVALSASLALLQLGPVARMLALDFEPDYVRNSQEWKGALIRLPIRALAERIPETRDGGDVRRLRVVTFGIDLISLAVAYPDLASRYVLSGEAQSPAAVDCRCRDRAEAVLAGFEWPTHFGDTPETRATYAHVSAACVEQINTTCASTILERHSSGAVVGALGVGRAVLLALPQHDERSQR
jgi:hypothetical protein